MAPGTLFPAQTAALKTFDHLDDNMLLVNGNNPGTETGSGNLNYIQAALLGGPFNDIRWARSLLLFISLPLRLCLRVCVSTNTPVEGFIFPP